MLFSTKELKYLADIEPSKILHVGAHHAEERDSYIESWGPNLEKIMWVEGQHDLAEKLRAIINPRLEKVVEAVIWSVQGKEMDFYLANNSEASSLLKFDQHRSQYPKIFMETANKVKTSTLENVLDSEGDFDFINLDIQGAELEALIGMGSKIDAISWIYTEINKKTLYENGPLLPEIKEFLSGKGFKLLAKRWTPLAGWGDAVFVKQESFTYLVYFRMLIFTYLFYAKQFSYRLRAFIRIRSRIKNLFKF